METYLSPDEIENPSVKLGKGFSDVEIAGIIAKVEELKTTVVWNVGVGGSLGAACKFKDGRIYIGAADKNFYCIDEETGKEIWRFSVNGPVLYMCSIENDVVYFTSYDQNLYALSTEDGKLLWKVDIGEKATAPIAHEGRVFVGSKKNKVYCFSGSGEKLWTFNTNGPVSGTPMIYKDTVVFGSWDKNLYALSFDGELKWRFQIEGYLIERGDIRNGVIYIGSFDGNVYAVSIDSGDLLWKFGTPEPIDMIAITTDKGVYFGSHGGTCYALSFDGKERWRFETNSWPGIGMTAADGKVFMTSSNNNIYALSESDGGLIWKFSAKGPMVNVTEHDGNLFVTSWDCHLYKLSREGELIWKFKTSLGYMAPVETEDIEPPTKMFKVVWQPAVVGKKKDKYKTGETGDYSGEFKSDYTSGLSMNYLGFEREEGLPGSKKKKQHYR